MNDDFKQFLTVFIVLALINFLWDNLKSDITLNKNHYSMENNKNIDNTKSLSRGVPVNVYED